MENNTKKRKNSVSIISRVFMVYFQNILRLQCNYNIDKFLLENPEISSDTFRKWEKQQIVKETLVGLKNNYGATCLLDEISVPWFSAEGTFIALSSIPCTIVSKYSGDGSSLQFRKKKQKEITTSAMLSSICNAPIVIDVPVQNNIVQAVNENCIDLSMEEDHGFLTSSSKNKRKNTEVVLTVENLNIYNDTPSEDDDDEDDNYDLSKSSDDEFIPESEDILPGKETMICVRDIKCYYRVENNARKCGGAESYCAWELYHGNLGPNNAKGWRTWKKSILLKHVRKLTEADLGSRENKKNLINYIKCDVDLRK